MKSSRRSLLTGTLSWASLTAWTSFAPAKSLSANRQTAAPIRIGQIGVAHAHASKLNVYRRSSDYEVIGIVEENETLRRVSIDKDPYRGLAWMTREELLSQPGLQAVLIETEIRDLLQHAKACLEAGLHVHIEPLDAPKVRLILDRPRGPYRKGEQIIELPKYTRYVDDALEMARAIRGEQKFPYSYAHDLAVQRTVLKASGVIE